jgi:hypothetical protein
MWYIILSLIASILGVVLLWHGITRRDPHDLGTSIIFIVIGMIGLFWKVGMVDGDWLFPTTLISVVAGWLVEKMAFPSSHQ